jgi:heme o synthase
VPMLPVTHGMAETRRQILIYTLLLVPATLSLAVLGVVGPLYVVPATALGIAFVAYAWRLYRSGSIPHAVHLFRFSILYLFLIYTALALDAAVRAWSVGPLR